MFDTDIPMDEQRNANVASIDTKGREETIAEEDNSPIDLISDGDAGDRQELCRRDADADSDMNASLGSSDNEVEAFSHSIKTTDSSSELLGNNVSAAAASHARPRGGKQKRLLKETGPSTSAPTSDKHGKKGNLVPSTAPAKSRSNVFQVVKSGEKCGSCKSCLNPAWKQACIVARERQLNDMQRNQKASKSRVTVSKSMSAAGKADSVKIGDSSENSENAVANDAFLRDLQKVTSPSGAIQLRHIDLLMNLMDRTRNWPHRTALEVVLQNSPTAVLEEVIAKKGLLKLQLWLSQAIETKRKSAVKALLETLSALPVTISALQPPCELGKMVGNLRKLEGMEAVRDDAKSLVTKWRALVVKSSSGVLPVSRSTGDGASVSASAPPPVDGETPIATSSELLVAEHVTKPGGSAAGSKLLSSSTGTTAEPLADGEDIFGSADKIRAGTQATPGPPAGSTATTQQAGPVAIDQQRPISSSSKKNVPSAAALRKPGISGGGSAQEPHPAGPRRAPAKTPPTPAPTPSFLDSFLAAPSPAPFPSSSLSTAGGGTTSLGSGLSIESLTRTAVKTAKEKAREAAARIPSPEPPPRKQKTKKVVWASDENLRSVRWFLMKDPPIAAQHDAGGKTAPTAATATPLSVEEAAEPAEIAVVEEQFASAAKQEHLSEAQALRQHREQEDQVRSEVESRMLEMVEQVAWYDPPLISAATMPSGLGRGKGEESAEAAAVAARHAHEPPATYASSAEVPPSATEPPEGQRGMAQPVSIIPRIPLEAAMNQHQQAPQQQFVAPVTGALPSAAAAPAAAPVLALPTDISAALAQLSASGVLSNAGLSQMAQQQQQQRYIQPQPPQPKMQVPEPRYRQAAGPPGMRVMVGLHRSGAALQAGNSHAAPGGAYVAAAQAGPSGMGVDLGQHPAVAGPGGALPRGSRGGRSRIPCRFFNSVQGCARGDTCNFAHISPHTGGAPMMRKRSEVEGGDGPPYKVARRH